MIKKILAISCIFCLVLSSFVFAEDIDNVYYATKTSGQKSNGVIYAPGVQIEGSTSNNTVEESTTQEQDNNTILAELYRKLAILRGEIPSDEVQVAANPIIVNNTDIASGYNSNGVAYGLARLGQIMGKRKEAEVTFVSATKVGEYSYIAEFKSSDIYCNGKFQIDLIGDGENKMDGYQWAFGIYDVNKKKIGNAQAKKVW